MCYASGEFTTINTSQGAIRVVANRNGEVCRDDLPLCFETEDIRNFLSPIVTSTAPQYLNDIVNIDYIDEARKLLWQHGIRDLRPETTPEALRKYIERYQALYVKVVHPESHASIIADLSTLALNARRDGIVIDTTHAALLSAMDAFHIEVPSENDETRLENVRASAYGTLQDEDENTTWILRTKIPEQHNPYKACLVELMRRLYGFSSTSDIGFDNFRRCNGYESDAYFRVSAELVFSAVHKAREYWNQRVKVIALAKVIETSSAMLSFERMVNRVDDLKRLTTSLDTDTGNVLQYQMEVSRHQAVLNQHRNLLVHYEQAYFAFFAAAGAFGIDPSEDIEIRNAETIVMQRGYLPYLQYAYYQRSGANLTNMEFEEIMRPFIDTIRVPFQPEEIRNARWLLMQVSDVWMVKAKRLASEEDANIEDLHIMVFQAVRNSMLARGAVPQIKPIYEERTRLKSTPMIPPQN